MTLDLSLACNDAGASEKLFLLGANVPPLELRGGIDRREGADHPPLRPDLPQGVVGNQVLQPRADPADSVQDEPGVQEAADVDENLVGKRVQVDILSWGLGDPGWAPH